VLLFTNARVDDIAAQGRAFKWERPCCPNGCLKVWGHGYVARYLLALVVLLRRFRCPTCRVVITLVPAGFCRRYQTGGAAMAAALASRLGHRGWPRGVPRQRAGHWLRKLLAICRMDHGADDPLVVLGRLLEDGIHFLG
jgi:hypothetical protein